MSTKYYCHHDALRNVVALSNVNGNIAERYKYTAFGKPSTFDASGTYTGKASSLGNPYMFTGRRYDPESNLYYYRARMYSAVLGRFLQTDPIGYYDSMNLYQYCLNNPINWIDPLGLALNSVEAPQSVALAAECAKDLGGLGVKAGVSAKVSWDFWQFLKDLFGGNSKTSSTDGKTNSCPEGKNLNPKRKIIRAILTMLIIKIVTHKIQVKILMINIQIDIVSITSIKPRRKRVRVGMESNLNLFINTERV